MVDYQKAWKERNVLHQLASEIAYELNPNHKSLSFIYDEDSKKLILFVDGNEFVRHVNVFCVS
jgi:hypothetical protein